MIVKNQRVILNVPYHEKNKAKKKGAKWDNNIKRWYIDGDKSIKDFLTWAPPTSSSEVCSIQLKSPLYLMESYEICWRCDEVSPVFTLLSEKLIENGVEQTDNFFILQFISSIEEKIKNILTSLCTNYYLDYSKTTTSWYFMNHCQLCKSSLGDHYMHNEPGGSFNPITSEDAALTTISKLPIDGRFNIKSEFNADLDSLIKNFSNKLCHNKHIERINHNDIIYGSNHPIRNITKNKDTSSTLNVSNKIQSADIGLTNILLNNNTASAITFSENAWDDYTFTSTLSKTKFIGRLYTRKADQLYVCKEKIFEEHLNDYNQVILYCLIPNILWLDYIDSVFFTIQTDRTKGYLYLTALSLKYDCSDSFDAFICEKKEGYIKSLLNIFEQIDLFGCVYLLSLWDNKESLQIDVT